MESFSRRTAFFLHPEPPFHFDGTFHKPSHFPNPLEVWEPGQYWCTIRKGRKIFSIKIQQKGTARKPLLRVSVFATTTVSAGDQAYLKQELNWRFGLDEDLTEFNQMVKRDQCFAPAFKHWLGMRSSCSHDLYGLMMIAVVLQNATVRRSVQMLKALLGRFGSRVRFDRKTLAVLWPPKDVSAVSEKELRDLRIGYRAKFIKRLSQDFAQGVVDEYKLRRIDQETAREELLKLYGVGPETVRILLFEACHQYDTFEHIAPWQQKIYSRLFYRQPFVSVQRISRDIKRQYGRFSMLAVHYIWEDVFWKRTHKQIPWLEKEIRL